MGEESKEGQEERGLIPSSKLLFLLQLTSPALPVGAYGYSEGLEALVEANVVHNSQSLGHWLTQELRYGAIRVEAAVMIRAYRSVLAGDLAALHYWNAWASAGRETEELRQQSWQMGRSLIRLLTDLNPAEQTGLIASLQDLATAVGTPCNYAIAFGIAAGYWQIDPLAAIQGYLHSWLTNLITAGIKLIPLGQTVGQQLILDSYPLILQTAEEVFTLEDDSLSCCSWGLALASMAHETQYTRLFRS